MCKPTLEKMTEKQIDVDSKDYQGIYEGLAEKWAVEDLARKEKELLWKIIDLIEEAKQFGRKIIIHTWMKKAIIAEKKDFVFPSEAILECDARAFFE